MLADTPGTRIFMQIIVKKKKKWQYSTVDGKADFDNLPCTTREPDTVFFLLILQFEQERQRNNTKYW